MTEHLKSYKCPNCSSIIEFSSKDQKLKCPSCDGTFDIENFQEAIDYSIDQGELFDNDNLVTYVCNNCGGAITTDKTTAATRCPYCNSPTIVSKNVSNDYQPKRVIPFKLDKQQAQQNYFKHLKKVLVPKYFSTQAVISEIKGLYVPYWLFDGKSNGKMWFDATRVRHYSDYDYDYTETKYYKLYRSCSVSFTNIPVDASEKIPNDMTESIEPFDNSKLVDYNDNYLVGYYANKYDTLPEKCRTIANDRITSSTIDLLHSTVTGYTTAVAVNSKIDNLNGKQEYVMYPVWMLTVNYKNKDYKFMMNGQTGKIVGNLPCDYKKLALILVSTFIISSIIVILLQVLIK